MHHKLQNGVGRHSEQGTMSHLCSRSKVNSEGLIILKPSWNFGKNCSIFRYRFVLYLIALTTNFKSLLEYYAHWQQSFNAKSLISLFFYFGTFMSVVTKLKHVYSSSTSAWSRSNYGLVSDFLSPFSVYNIKNCNFFTYLVFKM